MSRRINVLPVLEELDMMELEPSPIADSPTDIFSASFASSSDSRPHSRETLSKASTLNAPSSSVFLWLIRSQRYSSYVFTSFLGLHLTTTSLIPLLTNSISSSDNALLLARTAYQSTPLLETLLIPGALTVHVLSGIGLRLCRHCLAKKRYGKAPAFWEKRVWSTTSIAGWLLLPPLVAHAIVLRVVPLYVDGGSADVGLQYVTHGFNYHGRIGWWLNSCFYTGFVGTATWHVVNGFAKYFRIRNKRHVNIAAGVMTIGWLGGLFGVITRAGCATGYLGRKYDEFYDFVYGGLPLSLLTS
ncbi:hypothetical protein BGX38DRAFT_1162091 [Terfezia claveryi]|nr:hypothetical protein BGX38DRAFT_1162091 [Terfezia claveryi]